MENGSVGYLIPVYIVMLKGFISHELDYYQLDVVGADKEKVIHLLLYF